MLDMLQRNLNLSAIVSVAFLLVFCGNAGKSSTANVASVVSDDDSSVHPTGAIAYIRNNTEIRLIDSNGKNDRRLWTDTAIREGLELHDVSWRPDGKELAFSSSHEALFSLYEADLFAIRPDGTGFRKITNAPSRRAFGNYKKGTVTVTVRNNQFAYQGNLSTSSSFFVTVAGAEEPQLITVLPGASKTITFKSVCDFGKKPQAIVAIYGKYRWFIPGADVEAGKTVKAPDLNITGEGMNLFGAFRPVWKQDGSMISYRDGVCIVSKTLAHPEAGDVSFDPLFKGKTPMGTCSWAYGPTPFLFDQVLYTENSAEEGSGIFLMKEGGQHDASKKITLYSEIQYQVLHDLKWLPDGSGFLYSAIDLSYQSANIFWFDMQTRQTKQITQLNGEFARKFTVSPSGKWIVYERAKTNEENKDVDLWIVGVDGKGEKLLVKNGLSPSWSK
jgi:hypothetical protein